MRYCWGKRNNVSVNVILLGKVTSIYQYTQYKFRPMFRLVDGGRYKDINILVSSIITISVCSHNRPLWLISENPELDQRLQETPNGIIT